MCGICGYVSKEKIKNNNTITSMVETLTPRGPDNKGIYIHSNVALGHTRLAIRDIEGGVQPMTVEYNKKKYTIVYNGEIYNTPEIVSNLQQKGYEFKTHSDTEVVLASYIVFGEESLKMLDGIFAFTILNESKKEIFLARDPLGIKPLFYTINNGEFCFASEIKALLKHPFVNAKVGKNELCEIFGLGPAHTPGKTFFKNIFEILPGHYGIYSGEDLTCVKYWDLETNRITDDVDTAIAKVKELVSSSLKRQLVSDTPVCTMLSGGLDSSVLTTLAKHEIPDLTTFSINFEGNDKDFNSNDYQPTKDSDYVKVMVDKLHTNHVNVYFNNHDLFDSLKDAMIARDMPGMADIDSSMLVFCRKIVKQGFKVCISGECSDEIFGGYPWYYKENLLHSVVFPWARSFDIRSNILRKDIVSTAELKNYVLRAYNDTVTNVVYNSNNPDENVFRRTCYLTTKWFMNTLVERTDRMSMLSGLEVRVPFADKKLFEYVYNLSYKFKLGLVENNNIPIEKYLLRKAFEKDVPDEIVHRKKSPFPKTYDPEYLELLENEIKRIITSSTAPVLQIIDVKYLLEILNTHGENLKENWFGQLMTYPQTLAYLIQINMWLEEYNIELEI